MRALIVLVCIGLVSWSCDEQEKVVDIRDQSLGSYTYEMKIFQMTPAGMLHTGQTDGGTFELIKGSDDTAIEAKEGGLTTFAGQNVQKAEQGFTFDVRSQEGSAGGNQIMLQGFNGIEYNGGDYQGQFSSNDKTITVNFSFTHNRANFLVEVIGTKQP